MGHVQVPLFLFEKVCFLLYNVGMNFEVRRFFALSVIFLPLYTFASKKEQIEPDKVEIQEIDNHIMEEINSEKKVPVESAAVVDLSGYLMIQENIDRASVEAWRKIYLSEKRFQTLKTIIERSKEYRVYVRKIISEKNLPPELEYLPVIESSYHAAAKSKSGAVGLWQFMENSVANYLSLNEYIDERLDPWKSTVAGLDKLADNYKIYNDWYLALAAYNCGNGKISRAKKRCAEGEFDYWTISEKEYIPKQTAEYVPQLIAVADICTSPQKYGVDLPFFKEEYETLLKGEEDYEFVEVKKPYLVSELAKNSGIAEKELRRLNPSLIRHFTPPAVAYNVRVPFGKKQDMKDAVEKTTPLEFPFRYKVEKGDSLWGISRRYGVTVKSLCEINGIKENGILKIGQIIYVPKVNG